MEKINNREYYTNDKFYNKLIDYIIDYGKISCKGIQRDFNLTRTNADEYLQTLIVNRIIERLSGKGIYKVLIPSYKLPLPRKKEGSIERTKKTFIEDPELYADFVTHVRKTGRATQKELIEDFNDRCSMQDIKCYQILLKERNVIRMNYSNIGEGSTIAVTDSEDSIEIDDKWGEYTQKDIKFLEKKFEEYTAGFNIDRNPQTKNDIITICQLELMKQELIKKQKNGEDSVGDIQKIQKLINDTANQAKLSEKNRTADDYGADSLSKFISMAEQGMLANGVYINTKEIIQNELKIKKDEYDLILDNINLNAWNGR